MRIFIAREVKAVIRRRGEKKLTLSVFSPVSRKYGPQRNSANAFWMYPTGVERRSFTIAFSSQSISVLCTFDEYFTTRNVALKAASFLHENEVHQTTLRDHKRSLASYGTSNISMTIFKEFSPV